jgi:NAD(P)-dependent dehydrogenase (short-subunit alcohol dehydrogenase family)
MKIAITGSSSGIGLAIKNELEADHEIVCLDITDGYTIDDLSIIKHILDADVFINNAFSKTNTEAQQLLFETVYGEWKYTEKQIINVGSLSKYYSPEDTVTFPRYTNAKKALNEAHCAALVQKDRKVRLTQICPGYTDTAMIEEWDVPKLDVKVIALAIHYCIKMAAEGIEIADYTICKAKG